MEWSRMTTHPRLLVTLTLAFALVPVWMATITYRDARMKDERLFATTAEVLAEKMRSNMALQIYFIGTMRNQARPLTDDALFQGRMQPANFDWKGRLPHLLAFGYVEATPGHAILRWKSDERRPVAGIGDDLAGDSRVAAALRAASPTDPVPSLGCPVDRHQMLVLLAVVSRGDPTAIRGYAAGWLDLDAMCRDTALPLIKDRVLTATPLEDRAPTPAGARRMTIRDGKAAWDVAIARGPSFGIQYAPTPWLAFLAAGLSAVPLLILSMLAGRATKLRAALAAERELVRQQRFFTQSVSHEFRTPLGIIMSGADLLESYTEKLTPERRREVLAEIKDNTRHMNAMIEQVLLLGRIESSRLENHPEPVNLAVFCQAMAHKVNTATQDRCVITVAAPDREVMLDPAVLNSILGNLLSNAVKYSAPGRSVALEAEVADGRVIFVVGDQGIGIPPRDLARVGELFHRGSNVGNAPGSGLGLAIAHRCATLLGAILTVESKEGDGTTATLRVPASTLPS